MTARRISLGTQIDRIFSLRESIVAEQKRVDDRKQKLNAMKIDLIDSMERTGIDASRGNHASVSISTTIIPSVKDWDKFHIWMYKERTAHMMFKRLSDTAYREMLELRNGRDIPGVEPFEKTTLNIRKRTE